MGNVKSFCCKDDVSEIDDREERSRILNDNFGASCDDLYNNSNASAVSHQDTISYGSISKTLEQSALDKIYQKMASNVIDVAPGESMVIQPAEFMERQKLYQSRLNQIKTPLPLKLTNRVAKHIGVSGNTSTNSTSNNFTSNNLSHGNTTTATVNSATTNNNNNSPQHEKRRVEYEPISVEDVQLINDISLKSYHAIKSLKINSQEQVVAQFKPTASNIDIVGA